MLKNKKLLVTFDLNCLLGYIAPIKNFAIENTSYPDLLPHKVQDGYNIWTRPNLDILIKNIFFEKKSRI